MSPEFKLYELRDREGTPHVRDIEVTTSDTVPEEALSLEELRAAEVHRAAVARRRADASALGALMTSERSEIARVDFGSLTRKLPSGTVVYERLEQDDN